MMKQGKRKQAPGGGAQDRSKKSKKGNEGKWQTPNQRVNVLQRLDLGTTIEAGDAGIWVTCQRGLERKAMAELTGLCEELGETMYGIKPPSDAAEEAALESQSKGDDISDAVAAELAEMKAEPKKSKADYTFLPVRSGIECVFFMKTRAPVEPVAFVDRICDDAAACEDVMEQRKLRHINRLTPVAVIGKSLDKGVERVGRDVLGGHLELNAEEGDGVEERAEIPAHTYAIRPSIRASALKRDEVINRVAALVSPKHKVNLGNPDKVILIEIFKNHCGMSIVDGSRFDKMKKFNINEIYKLAGKKDGGKDAGEDEAAPKGKEGGNGTPGGEKTGVAGGAAEGEDGNNGTSGEKTDEGGLKPAGE